MSKAEYLYNDVDLRTASVFDLTDDENFLSRFFIPDFQILTKEDYLQLVKDSPTQRAVDMLEFAEEENDEELISKLKSVYQSELSSLFNE